MCHAVVLWSERIVIFTYFWPDVGGRFSETQARAATTGMRTLLQLHNIAEVRLWFMFVCYTFARSRDVRAMFKTFQLRELCDELGIPDHGLSNEEIVDRIFEMVRLA